MPKNNPTPVLEIEQFDELATGHDVYANRFSEHVRKHHAHIMRPHKHAFYLTILFTSGTGFHEIDFVQYTIQPGTVFFLQPGQTHHWEFSEDTEGWVFFHTESFWQFHAAGWPLHDLPFFRSQRHTPALHPEPAIVALLDQHFSTLLEEYEQAPPIYHYRKMALLVQTIYIELARCMPASIDIKEGTGEYLARFHQLEALIDAHFLTEKSPGFYADQLSISERHLNRIVQQFTGKSTLHLITERTMLEARRLLGGGQLRPGETATFLGYDEYAYFSRLFTNYCGMNPREFKRQYD